MAGLLDNAIDVKPATANMPTGGTVALASATGLDPEKRTIDASKETVAGQLDGVLKSDSPLVTRARAGAAQTANRRGLLNSSMAAGAGEAAAIDAALPIATADANVYGTASRDNQAATNAALAQTADAANKASATNATAMNELSLQSMKGTQANELAQIEANYKTLIQASDSAGKLYQQITDSINKTMTSDLDPGAKDAFVRRQTELLRSGLGIIGKINNLDLTSILNFGGVTA